MPELSTQPLAFFYMVVVSRSIWHNKSQKNTMSTSTSQRATLFLLREFGGDLISWPIWWYSTGTAVTARSLWRQWRELAEWLSLRILLKTMFKPMYGDYSKSGRAISFVIRLLLIVTRTIVLAVWSVVELVAMLAWLAGPVVAGAMLIRQLVNV